jgi:hypothetical protein
MSPKSQKALGRPTLKPNQQAVVFGELSLLQKGSPEYREKRLELARKFKRTENGIELLFKRLREKASQENGQHTSDKVAAPASSTSGDVGSSIADSSGPSDSKEE